MAEHTFASLQEAETCMLAWQARMGLHNWDVSLKIAGCKELGPDSQGRCYWTKKKRQATILLLDPRDYPNENRHFPQDHELTLVHELLHLHGTGFDDFEDDGWQDVGWEQAIHHISSALVALHREKQEANRE